MKYRKVPGNMVMSCGEVAEKYSKKSLLQYSEVRKYIALLPSSFKILDNIT
jgi:hypothetical protein